MRLLIITQKADSRDPVLGFFHRWIEEFGRTCDSVIVAAQQEGEHKFAANVRVLSLGKEHGHSTWQQVRAMWSILRRYRNDYDAVLVHMTPVWVDLTFPLLLLLRKRLYLWYEVKRGGWILRLAVMLSKRVFCATSDGLPFSSRKAMILGHGIDTDAFAPGSTPRDPALVVAAGRITPVKRYGKILKAFAALPSSMRLVIAGGAVTPPDAEEKAALERQIQELNLTGRVTIAARPHAEVKKLFQQASLSLHACLGGLDKVVLESMACGCPVVSSSEAARHVLPPECQATEETLGERAKEITALQEGQKAELSLRLRQVVVDHHHLTSLIRKMTEAMQR